ncbi:GGDEF domain-containing protein [Shewanella kaireitica]|nr:GGDEF domain-containing protein [Shewanella kaireitica]MCL1095489.1 GGDEF domain-containing protein [Shewanella kaireitica]
MSAFYHRCRYFFLPLFFTSLLLAVTQYSLPKLQTWHSVIEQLPFWLLPVVVIIALQFNRSRLAYLALLLLAYCYFLDQGSPTTLFDRYPQQIFLAGIFTVTWFAFIKDRGLLSAHGVVRVLGVLLSFAAAFAWIWGNTQYKSAIDNYLPSMITMEIRTLAPFYLGAMLVFVRGIWQANLVNTAIFITLALWAIHSLMPELLSVSVSITALAIVYILTVLTDSYFLAYRDELTGLASRRALYNLVLSLGRKYSVAMLDIDHFKKFNDTYGHDVGDQVLKLVASKISQVRGGGKAFRYGGEEFTIVFSRKDTSSILHFLEEVREIIEDYDITLRNEQRKLQTKAKRGKAQTQRKTVNVTISIGVSEHQHGETFEQTLKKADQALYRAKKKGRNQVCV